MKPLFHEILYHKPSIVFRMFANNPGSILLESTQKMADVGRYSFIMIDPWQVLTSKQCKTYLNQQEQHDNFFDVLQRELDCYKLNDIPGLPPFQGGVAGYLGYEAGNLLEKLPQAKNNEFDMDDIWLGFYDLLIAFDNVSSQAWIISTGFPELYPQMQRAKNRLNWLEKKIIKS